MAKKIFGTSIGVYSERKLRCIQQYLSAYSNIITNAKHYEKYYLIDGFAGTGHCISKSTSKKIDGTAAIALNTRPSFSKYFFIELDKEKVNELETLKKDFPRKSIEIFRGDCNLEIDKVLQEIEDNIPFIALLDPQAGDLNWQTLERIAQKNKAELLVNFPFGMAINRYMSLKTGGSIDRDKLNKIFGSDAWESIYEERKKRIISPSKAREKYLDLYLKGLQKLGFKYYAAKDLKNSKNVHIYYLIFATRNLRGLEKMKVPFVEGEDNRKTLFFRSTLETAVYKNFSGSKNLTLLNILEKMLSGKHLYTVQDFKNALKTLEANKKLERINPRPRCRSFKDTDRFNIA